MKFAIKRNKYQYLSLLFLLLLLLIWQVLSTFSIIPPFLFPSPSSIIKAIIQDAPLIFYHAKLTLLECFLGILLSILLSFATALLMFYFPAIDKMLSPILVITQTIPTIAIAPILVLWCGYGILSKILLIIINCFFPLTINILTGFKSVDSDYTGLLKSYGANRWQLFYILTLPASLPYTFSGLKIALSYSVISAVVAEWLGGNRGLGVYMIRVKKSYSFDKMFAVIVIIAILSVLLIKITEKVEKVLIKK